MRDDPARLLAQHARTTQLLGVDFLPLGTPPENLIAERRPKEETVQSQLEPKPLAHHALPEFQSEPAADRSEPKAEPRAETRAEPGSTGLVPIGVQEIRALYDDLTDPAEKLKALLAKYEHDAPHRHFNTRFNSIVFGEGSPTADLMFIGEAPGEQEDISGRPFVGRAGQLLEKMIIAMGLSRQTVYICNVLKTRPPNNATPTSDEARLSAPYLFEQIRIVAPKVIVTLGLPASHLLLGTTSPMRALRGRWHTFPPPPSAGAVIQDIGCDDLSPIEVMATYHPAYLLRSYTEENRRKVWSDLQMVMSRLQGDAP